MKDTRGAARGWKSNDWRNEHGEPKEETRTCGSKLSFRPDTKTGRGLSILNGDSARKTRVLKRVDKAAKAAATRGAALQQIAATSPELSLARWSKGRLGRFPAKGQVAVIEPHRKNMVGKGEEKARLTF